MKNGPRGTLGDRQSYSKGSKSGLELKIPRYKKSWAEISFVGRDFPSLYNPRFGHQKEMKLLSSTMS